MILRMLIRNEYREARLLNEVFAVPNAQNRSNRPGMRRMAIVRKVLDADSRACRIA